MGVLTAAAEKQKTRLTHPVWIDFFRVLSAFCVGWFHIWQQSWVRAGRWDHWPRSGAVWVDVLVLLSAFCLMLPDANAWAAGDALPESTATAFWKRRARRIIPSYYAVLAAALAMQLVRHGRTPGLLTDLLAHLSFTQMFVPGAYIGTKLNGVTWTLTVYAVFYLLFPFLRRAMLGAPLPVTVGLLAVQGGYTLWASSRYGEPEYPLLFNQFPAFCGVWAVGMAGAMLFARLGRAEKLQTTAVRLGFSAVGLVAMLGIDRLLRLQAAARAYQLHQLLWRMPLALAAGTAMVCLSLGITLPLAGLWRFLAEISYNFYLWHQMLAVWLKYEWRIPAWTGATPPNQLGDAVWMRRYNALAWAVAFAAAVAGTYLIEKPAGWQKQKNRV